MPAGCIALMKHNSFDFISSAILFPMATSEITEPKERIRLAEGASARRSPAEFLASFDLGRVPTAPGCYIMRDQKGRVVYVGKAKNIRSRVRMPATSECSLVNSSPSPLTPSRFNK